MLLRFLLELWRDEHGGSSLGRLALVVAGTVVGSFFGAPQLGLIAGTIAGTLLFPAEGPGGIEGPRLDNLSVTSSAYGRPIQILHGTHRLGGTVVWSPGLEEHRREEEVGGKGIGGGGQTQVSYSYTASFRVNFCEGPAEAILKVWADGKLIGSRDTTGIPFVDMLFFKTGPGTPGVRLYLGTETQLPDQAEQADKGINATSAYRGMVSIVFEDMPLENYGNRIPQITAEVATSATDVFPVNTINPVGNTLSFSAFQPDGANYLTNDDTGNITRVNTLSQMELGSVSVPGISSESIDFPAIDNSGNFYLTKETGLNNWNVVQVDGVSLLTISTTLLLDPIDQSLIVKSVGFSHGRVFGGVILLDGTRVGELICLTGGSDPNIVIVGVSGGNAINAYDLVNTPGVGMAVDGDRALWLHATVGADVLLTKISPGNGSVAETHTITGESATNITYDAATNSIILGNPVGANSSLIRWSIDTQTIEARIDTLTLDTTGSRHRSAFWNGPSPSGRMYLQTGGQGDFVEVDIRSMTSIRVWDNTDFGLSGDVEFALYDFVNHAVLGRDIITGDLTWRFLDRMSSNLVTVRSIVEAISARVGLIAGTDINATALTDTVISFVVDRRMQARSAMANIAEGFFFRAVETDFIVDFPKRGSASVQTIPANDLAARNDDKQEEVLTIEETRIQEVELPEVVDVSYAGQPEDYQAMVQTSKRPRATMNSVRRRNFPYSGSINDDQAAQISDKLLYTEWLNRKNLNFRGSQKHFRLDPADVVTIVDGADNFVVELQTTDLGANNLLEMASIIDDAASFTSPATGSAGGAPTQTIVLTGPSAFFPMDTVLFRDADDGFGIYMAGGSFSDLTWPGEEVRRSLDARNFIAPFVFIPSSRNSDHGFAKTALPSADPEIWDRTNSLVVSLSKGTLVSSTEDAVLDGANILLIGNEVVQFVTATAGTNPQEFTISTLLRGRRGSEAFTGTHIAGERVVVISASTTLRVGLDISELNTTYFYKGITLGGNLNSATVKSLLNLGRSSMPRAPSRIAGTISATDWTFTWNRRTRIGGSWQDSIDAILGEQGEVYEVDVLSGPGGTIKRTITSTTSANGSVVTPGSQSAFYDDADQVIDFSGVQTTLTIIVYQISESVGRGFGTEVTLVGG